MLVSRAPLQAEHVEQEEMQEEGEGFETAFTAIDRLEGPGLGKRIRLFERFSCSPLRATPGALGRNRVAALHYEVLKPASFSKVLKHRANLPIPDDDGWAVLSHLSHLPAE